MDVIQLQPDSVVNLTLLALVVPFAAYLLSLRDKDAATWWLIVHLAGSALALLASAIDKSIFWGVIFGSTDPSVPERVLFRLPYLFRLMAAWAYVQFAYAVLHDRFPREARRARAGTALLVLSAVAVLGYDYVSTMLLNFNSLSGSVVIYADNLLVAGLYIWALVVFARKWWLVHRARKKQGRRVEAYSFYALLTCAVLVSIAFRAGTQLGLPMPESPWFLESLLGIGFTFGLAFAFVNYTARATTFQVKLVGLTLTATLLVLASAVAITAEVAEDELQGEPIPSSQAYRFIPDGRGGYEVESTAIEYDVRLGENLGLGDRADSVLVLPFGFPFGGVRRDTIHAYSDGFVTVGSAVDASRSWRHRYIHREDVSMIILLHSGLSPARGGGVFARIDPDRLVVTWHDVPHSRGLEAYSWGGFEDPVHYGPYPTTNRVQLVLHADGAIDMVYDRVMIPPGLRTFGGRGLIAGRAPGEPAEPDLGVVFREQMFVDFSEQPSFSVPARTSILEDFYVKYRYRLHERLRPLAWLVLGATFFVVLIVPHFYRWSLTRPLERLLDGMKRVDGGTLDVTVPVGVQDEIGRVTNHFNQMTGSLREADAELRAYAEHLEERVEERTAALQAEKAKTEAQAARLLELDEAKSRFFANVSHELRTPLTLLLGPLRDALAAPECSVPPQQLPAMRRSAERLLSLVDELLDLARLDAGRLQLRVAEHDLVALTRRTVLAFTSRAEREGLALGFEAGPERLDAWVDAERVERVISNLLTNAFKFTPSGGRIRVTLDERDGTAVLTVRDMGEGIRPDLLPHVFERFRQGDDATTRRHEGAGIGLALVQELVALHGGSVAVESEVGVGSTFTVRLRLGKDHFDADAFADTSASVSKDPVALPLLAEVVSDTSDEELEPVVRADATVLVVEDHADMRAYLRDLLMLHYRVEQAEDGQDGLEMALRLAAERRTPDLVISDVMMPRLDGYALCHALKADDALGHVPVVLLTARADEESKLVGLGEGADDYLAKPFSADELLARCENLIEVRRRLRAQFSGEVVVKPAGVVRSSEEAVWLDEVTAVCETRLGDANFGVDWLADELGVSARTLRRRVKAASGLTPGAFLRTLRLERAARLFEQGARSVAEVAAAVGYAEAESFSRAFRQGFGVPPSTYAEVQGRGGRSG